MPTDRLAGILAISEDAKHTVRDPTGHHLNHLQGKFGTGSILLSGGLPGLLALQFSAFARCPLVGLALAVHTDQDGEGPVLIGSEGQGDLQREDHKVVGESEEGAFLSGAQGVVVHAGAPDVAAGFTGEGIT